MMSTQNDVIVIPASNESDKIPCYKQTIPVNIYHFYITDEIGEANRFLDLINALKTAETHDTVFIYLNTPGGSLQTTIQILSAMKQSVATVVTCLEGEVCSAGTLIFLAGDKHIVNPNCTFMIHNYSQWVGGKGNDVALRVKYSEEYFKKLAKDLYGGFLSEDEISEVTSGRDLWMDSDEVTARLHARNALDAAEADKKTESDISKIIDEQCALEDRLDKTVECVQAKIIPKRTSKAVKAPAKKTKAK